MTKKFGLAGLLRLRGIQERDAAQTLSRANRDEQRTQARDRQLRDALSVSGSTVTDSASLRALSASRSAARGLLSDLHVLAEAQQVVTAQAREAHTTARIGELGLTKLAEAHAAREQERELAAEQAELDEIAIRPKTEETS
ncbi:hypothetical protein [Microbacterium sp. 77mftsu3.1]|uniref:hypothetical protein n=1 Tax=Microbacterium sp. 77mftsu3.1 TaxID=1761802 RepID=UPI00037F5629|nr:hypothetical protein [Microbacterium sp. 77mftsu3.1]SDH36469.1 flagellar export protein FliJ [Microbacterium sp. 77mftsu3.1]